MNLLLLSWIDHNIWACDIDHGVSPCSRPSLTGGSKKGYVVKSFQLRSFSAILVFFSEKPAEAMPIHLEEETCPVN